MSALAGTGLCAGAPLPLLSARHISKRFGATQALDDVSVDFLAGEVHALMGENGAGKSTLGKVIAGLHAPDAGEVILYLPAGPRTLRHGDLREAFDAGVRLVHQELAQCPNLSVAENLLLHRLPLTRLRMINRAAMRTQAARLVHQLEPGIDVDAPLGSLSPGRRQVCQIAACLDDTPEHPTRIIVFDEPTSSLSAGEAERLMEIIRVLKARGIGVIYVSHRMGEIFNVCDRVTVLRNGRFVATSPVSEIDESTLVQQMIGREIGLTGTLFGGTGVSPGSSTIPALHVEQLFSPRRLHDITLAVQPGEIVGVGGLVGCGRSELLDAIFGLDPRAFGEVSIAEVPMHGHGASRVRRAIAAGVGYVPEDRRIQGLFFQLGIDENMVMPMMARLARRLGIRRRGVENALVADRLARFHVKAASARSQPGELSGGNQQKLLLARWMSRECRVLLLDEPTRGIDIGAKAEVHRLVRQAAADGAAVLLVSSEMPELLALSHRIIVLRDGRIAGELRAEDATQESVLRLATGVAQRAA